MLMPPLFRRLSHEVVISVRVRPDLLFLGSLRGEALHSLWERVCTLIFIRRSSLRGILEANVKQELGKWDIAG
jgi:hypothetical protein